MVWLGWLLINCFNIILVLLGWLVFRKILVSLIFVNKLLGMSFFVWCKFCIVSCWLLICKVVFVVVINSKGLLLVSKVVFFRLFFVFFIFFNVWFNCVCCNRFCVVLYLSLIRCDRLCIVVLMLLFWMCSVIRVFNIFCWELLSFNSCRYWFKVCLDCLDDSNNLVYSCFIDKFFGNLLDNFLVLFIVCLVLFCWWVS